LTEFVRRYLAALAGGWKRPLNVRGNGKLRLAQNVRHVIMATWIFEQTIHHTAKDEHHIIVSKDILLKWHRHIIDHRENQNSD
jgi:hypothetical protein